MEAGRRALDAGNQGCGREGRGTLGGDIQRWSQETLSGKNPRTKMFFARNLWVCLCGVCVLTRTPCVCMACAHVHMRLLSGGHGGHACKRPA